MVSTTNFNQLCYDNPKYVQMYRKMGMAFFAVVNVALVRASKTTVTI